MALPFGFLSAALNLTLFYLKNLFVDQYGNNDDDDHDGGGGGLLSEFSVHRVVLQLTNYEIYIIYSIQYITTNIKPIHETNSCI